MFKQFLLICSCIAIFSALCITPGFAQDVMKRNHEVHLDSAKKFINNLKKDAVQMKIRGGMFNRTIFEKILSQKGVIGIRYYYAKTDDGTPTLVLVGVDSTGNDMTNATVAETTFPCPPYCATESKLDK